MDPSRASSSASTFFGSSNHNASTSSSALASTSTLVNPPPSLDLFFDRNSVINTTLHSRAGPLYKVTTNKGVTRTDLCDLSEQRVVATVKRREIFPDVVVFAHRNGKSIQVRKWLRRRKPPQVITPCAVLETEVGRFTWRSDSTYRLALYHEGQTQSPIAFCKVMHDPPTLALMLRPGLDNLHVEIITSFLILEHRLRMKEKIRVQANQLYGPLVGGQFLTVG
ncbi:hypothetical protein B0H34DRAFT_293991 [Crassisporium funariophilum]|nr:hypothetical protein B0H34DRAFT_293991 [Crassisporium funariophilum]